MPSEYSEWSAASAAIWDEVRIELGAKFRCWIMSNVEVFEEEGADSDGFWVTRKEFWE